ncbi:MAG: hypothetical protein ACR2OJ_08540 [Hyphomicrobiales bacterium]
MPRIGIITGLALEADILRKPEWTDGAPLVRASGPGLTRAYETAQSLITEGATALMSFGLCGGLSPRLLAGDIVLASKIISEDTNYVCDAAWHQALSNLFPQSVLVHEGTILSARAVAATPERKRELHLASGADAVDMESAAVAKVAKEANIPFIALRAVSDPAEMALPPLALTAMDADGGVKISAVVMSLIKHPFQLTLLPELARNSKFAQRTLKDAATAAGPSFGL